MPSSRPTGATQISTRPRVPTGKTSRYSSTRRLVAKLETSISKVGAAVGAAPMAVRPSAPNRRTASRSTSSPLSGGGGGPGGGQLAGGGGGPGRGFSNRRAGGGERESGVVGERGDIRGGPR